MRILELEQKYSELKSDLGGQQSKRTKLIKISGYLEFALSLPNHKLIEPFIADLIPDFIKYSSDLEIRGLNPKKIELLKDQVVQLNNLNLNGIESLEYDKVIQSLENKVHLMNNWLYSVQTLEHKPNIYFPLLEKFGDDLGTGYLETVNVVIEKGEQKFNMSPSGLENDEQLEKQIQLCFDKALEYCSRYIRKVKKTNIVYIHFENRLGILTGNSLGAALTLLFIEALLKHYNSSTILNVSKTIAITGGIDHDSKIIATSKTIIGAKVETVFYSDVEIMCVSKIDEMWAEEKLKELQTEYPKRNLKIIGLTDLNDLLDRRQIVDIRKQKFIIRGGKFVKNNWISAIATVLMAMVFAYLFVMDFDDNPVSLTTDGNLLYVKNKNEKVLWTKKVGFSNDAINDQKLLGVFCRIYDIDADGDNEVLISNELLPNENSNTSRSQLICYDKESTKLWSYTFTDSVESEREILKPLYSILLVDTLTIGGIKNLFLISTNSPSFSSAIYRLDIRTGKRLPGTMWCSGHMVDAIIKDVDKDDKKDILAIGLDNGFEEQVVFALQIDTLTKVRPSTNDYTIKNFPIAELISYIRIPKTDFTKFKNSRLAGFDRGALVDETFENLYRFIILVTDRREDGSIWIKLDYNLKDFDFVIGDQFRVNRDTLIAQDKLKPPYTDTEEYKNIIKNNILYWKNGKWVKRNELD